ncbi:hypothetical protein EGW08_020067, partial [Elysia chlorotica]
TIDFHNVFGNISELVDQPLAVHFVEDSASVHRPEGAAHRLVVHVWLVLVLAPEPRHGLAVDELEDALVAVGPLDVVRAGVSALEQLQEELPQVLRVAWT